MIDYLTPFEGVVFGGIIAIGILCMLSPADSTQMFGAVLLTAGFWGGAFALVRGLLHRGVGSWYLLSFVGALIAGLVKFFVFPDTDQSYPSPVIWPIITGVGVAGIIGTLLNAVIHKPKDDSEETPLPSAQGQPSQGQQSPESDASPDMPPVEENTAETTTNPDAPVKG